MRDRSAGFPLRGSRRPPARRQAATGKGARAGRPCDPAPVNGDSLQALPPSCRALFQAAVVCGRTINGAVALAPKSWWLQSEKRFAALLLDPAQAIVYCEIGIPLVQARILKA